MLMPLICQQEPVDLAFLAPLAELSEILSHEQKFFARVPEHESIAYHQVLEFFLQIARHFVDHRAFQVDNLIVREHQNVVLGKCIGHAEGHLVMVVFAEVWIELHVIEEVMHPSHVPFVGEMQAAVLYASRYLRPRCGLLGDHDDTFVSSAHQGIQVFEELDGFEIFISAVLVRHPLARLFP